MFLRRSSAFILALLISVTPAWAQESDIERTCKFMLFSSIPGNATQLPDLEEQLMAQLHLEDYYASLKSPNAMELRNQMREDTLVTALKIMDREQSTPTTGEHALETGVLSRLLQRYEDDPNLHKRLRDVIDGRVASVLDPNDISPTVMKLVGDLDLPVFRENTYLMAQTRRRPSDHYSIDEAMDVAQNLRTAYDKFRHEQYKRDYPENTTHELNLVDGDASARRIQELGLTYDAVRNIASNIADSILQHPSADGMKRENLLVGMRVASKDAEIETTIQLLNTYGLPEKAEILKSWHDARGKFETNRIHAENGARKGAARLRAELRDVVRMREFEKDPSAESFARALGKMETDFADVSMYWRFRQYFSRLEPDQALILSDKFHDSAMRADIQMDIAREFKKSGEVEKSRDAFKRAGTAISELRAEHAGLISMNWSSYMSEMKEADPNSVWDVDLPNAIRGLNQAYNDEEWTAEKNRFRSDKLRGLQSEINNGKTSRQFSGLFAALVDRTKTGRERFDGERALGHAALITDPTLRFGAEMAICSLVHEQELQEKPVGTQSPKRDDGNSNPSAGAAR